MSVTTLEYPTCIYRDHHIVKYGQYWVVYDYCNSKRAVWESLSLVDAKIWVDSQARNKIRIVALTKLINDATDMSLSESKKLADKILDTFGLR